MEIIESEDEDRASGTVWPKPTKMGRHKHMLTRRRFCPIEGCPGCEQAGHKGFLCLEAYVNHMREHAGGRLIGSVPRQWLDEFRKELYLQCNRIVGKNEISKTAIAQCLHTRDWRQIRLALVVERHTREHLASRRFANRGWAQDAGCQWQPGRHGEIACYGVLEI